MSRTFKAATVTINGRFFSREDAKRIERTRRDARIAKQGFADIRRPAAGFNGNNHPAGF